MCEHSHNVTLTYVVKDSLRDYSSKLEMVHYYYSCAYPSEEMHCYIGKINISPWANYDRINLILWHTRGRQVKEVSHVLVIFLSIEDILSFLLNNMIDYNNLIF